jgi:Synergist-CTERM protein sorting domain-containing protein
LTLTIKDASLHDEMWLTFFFYKEGNNAGGRMRVDIVKQATEIEPGTYEVSFEYLELLGAGLKYGEEYTVIYANEFGDISGHSIIKGITFKELKKDDDNDHQHHFNFDGCTAGYAVFALMTLVPLFFIKRKR